MSKIDDLACFDVNGADTFKVATDNPDQADFQYPINPPERVAAIHRDTLLQIRAAVNQAYGTLRQRRQSLWNSPIGAPRVPDGQLAEQLALVRAAIAKIDLNKFFSSALEDLSEKARRQAVRINLDLWPEDAEFVACLNVLEKVLDKWFAEARRPVDEALATTADAPLSERLLKNAVRFYFDNFDRYDMVSHPILYATDAGDELDRIEVFRISPEDATQLVDEAETGKKKLFGTKLANFGAFFKRDFRTNDILWGRLDGAERIITALLPDADFDRKRCKPPHPYNPLRDQLIAEAQNAILKEVLGVEDESHLKTLLEEFANRAKRVTADDETAAGVNADAVQTLAQDLPEPRVKFALTSFLKNQKPVELFRESFLDNYETMRQFNNQDMVKDAARASKVFGRMLEGYADDHKINDKRVTWVTRLAQLFWGLVEVAIPGSIANLIFQHWLKLVYLFEFLLILLGTLLTNQAAQQFGWLTFGITVTIHAAQLVLSDALTGRHWLRRLLVALSLLAVLLLAVLGITTFVGLFYMPKLWRVLVAIQAWQANPSATGRTSVKVVLVTIVAAFLVRALWKGVGERISTRWLGLLPLLLGAAIIVGMILSLKVSGTRDNKLPGGLHMPALAMEIVTTPAEVSDVEKYASPSGNDAAAGVEKLRAAVNLDFGFIAWYTAVFLLFSYWLKRRGNYPAGLGWAAAGLALVTAAFDIIENLQLYAVLGSETANPTLLQRLHMVTLLKWVFCFETVLVLSLLFLKRKDQGYLFGLGLVAVGVTGLAGVFYYRLIEFAFVGLAVLLVCIGLFAIVAPGRLLSRDQISP
jgi:hypothetical protein